MAKSPKIRILSALLAAGVGLLVGAAKADVLASSVIELTNLQFSHTGGAILTFPTDFSLLSFSNTGQENAQYIGFAGLTNSGAGTPLDLPLVCVGPGSCGVLTNNGFQFLNTVTGSFGAADQNESGAPIAGLGQPTGATVASGAWAQVKQPTGGDGFGSSNNGLSASIIFAPSFTGTVDITSGFSYFFDVFLSAGESIAAFAHSTGNVDFNLVDLTTGLPVFDFQPSGPNWNFSLNGPAPINETISNGPLGTSGTFTFTTPTLIAGQLYQLTAREATFAEASRVPEPATLGLFGVSLLGLFLARRKGLEKR